MDNQLTIQRLEAIVWHLRHGEPLHPNFRFSVLSCGEFRETRYGTCGTNGCAIGEFPAIFPKCFKYNSVGVLCDRAGRYVGTEELIRFLKIDERVFFTLFFPAYGPEYIDLYVANKAEEKGCKQLDADATKLQVAKNIQGHIDWLKNHE